MTFEALTETLQKEQKRRIAHVQKHANEETAEIMRIPMIWSILFEFKM